MSKPPTPPALDAEDRERLREASAFLCAFTETHAHRWGAFLRDLADRLASHQPESEELTMIALALKNQGIEGVTPERGVELLIERLYARRDKCDCNSIIQSTGEKGYVCDDCGRAWTIDEWQARTDAPESQQEGRGERWRELLDKEPGPFDRERFTIAICPACGGRQLQTHVQRKHGGTYCYCKVDGTTKGDPTRCEEIDAVAIAALDLQGEEGR